MLNKKLGTDILLGIKTVSRNGTQIAVENLGATEIRGLKEPMEIYRVI